MAYDAPTITNHEAFGKKVKAWAKGEDQIPETVEELKAQLDAAGVGVSIPDWVKRVKILVPDDETVVVRLIPKRLLEQSEREIVDGDGEYPLPGFYERVFGTKPTIHDKKALQSARIADYTISMCA